MDIVTSKSPMICKNNESKLGVFYDDKMEVCLCNMVYCEQDKKCPCCFCRVNRGEMLYTNAAKVCSWHSHLKS